MLWKFFGNSLEILWKKIGDWFEFPIDTPPVMNDAIIIFTREKTIVISLNIGF